ncbi:MAG: alpha/beta hydrolase fold domain-containing protein, partial [Actinomycetota bacterium]
MSEILLIESIVALAFVVNALRPLPWWTGLSIPSFLTSWLTMELAPQSLVIGVGVTAGLVAAGGWRGTAGAVGIGLSVLTWAGLVAMIVQAQRVRGIVDRALDEGLGDEWLARIAPHRQTDYDLRVPWRQLVMPFWMRHPDVERIKNVPYGEVRRRNLLDVYVSKERPTGAPILLQIHGGGWINVSNKDHQGKPLMLHFASRGWVCFAPNYRLSPKSTWPAQIVDVKKAVAWIKEHAHEYGADPSFIVVTGGSAGGHLASLLALTSGDPSFQPGFEEADCSVQAAAPHYGIYDFADTSNMTAKMTVRFLERAIFKKRLRDHREEFEAASPVRRIGAEAPPFFVIHGRHDSLAPVEQTRRFVQKLREVSKEPVAYAELPGAQHAFDVFPSIRTAHVIRAVERFADYAYG